MSSSFCNQPHPDSLIDKYGKVVTCFASAQHPNHPNHFGMHDDTPAEWVNPDFVPPPPPPSKARNQDIRRGMKKVSHKVERSSVQTSATHERRDGIEKAHGSLEPGFREAAIFAATELSKIMPRWTVDEFWDLLDATDIYTEHPKGMTGLLRSLQAMGVIEKVPEDDLDSLRPSRRTNESRMVQVYRSLIYEEDFLRRGTV